MVPQWDLLNLLAEAARAEPTFTLRMSTEVTGLLRDGGRVTGVRYDGTRGPGELQGRIDGRLRRPVVDRAPGGGAADAHEYPVNFDVWWFRLPRDGDAEFILPARVGPGKALGVIPREGYNQIAYLGPKGRDAQLRARGIEAFRRDVDALLPDMPHSVAALTVHGRRQAPRCPGRIGCVAGTPTGCCASATPRTRCLHWAASASTWPSKMPSRPRPYWPNRCGATTSPNAIWPRSAVAAYFPPR